MANNWFVLQSKSSNYADVEGIAYEYPASIPNGRQVNKGDAIVFSTSVKEAHDGRRVFGIGVIGRIEMIQEGKRLAYLERYAAIEPALTFEQVGGDPRNNRTNSINGIDDAIFTKILQAANLHGLEDLPLVEESKQEIETKVLREELHEAVLKDLLGPAAGPEEEILGMSVRDRYLVGALAPPQMETDVLEEDDNDSGSGADDAESGGDEGRRPANRSLAPSAVGMTFCIDSSAEEIEIEARWGRYLREDSEFEMTESGQAKKCWRRHSNVHRELISTKERKLEPIDFDGNLPGLRVRGVIRPPTPEGERLITLFLVNETPGAQELKDAAWIFQPELIVRSPSGEPIFRKRPASKMLGDDDERLKLAMMYRDSVEFAVGHGISVHADPIEEGAEISKEVRTVVVPSYEVPATVQPDPERDDVDFSSLELNMRRLADMERPELVANLHVLTSEYRKWIERNRTRIDSGELQGYEDPAWDSIDECEIVVDRLEEAVDEFLADEEDEDALEAFRFANRAMALQRIHSIYAMKRRRGEEADLAEIEANPFSHSWRPFQLAFVLLNLPSLTDPTHPSRSESASAVAELLWFPTGGGKTEAYLGVAAYVMAIRRLKSDLGGYDANHGLAVIMRYTLRLLTLQQFERASTLLCAMETIRKGAIADGDQRWGKIPFRLGLWVGMKVTPNATSDSDYAVKRIRAGQQPGGGRPDQLTNCPWCGNEIDPGRDIDVETFSRGRSRTIMYCSDEDGVCAFSRALADKEGLPVCVVDEELYRQPPSMLIATVDKFAQMAWKGDIQTMFGRVEAVCDRHGFIWPGSSDTGNHQAKYGMPRSQRQEGMRIRPPDLIIQDEFHLISGSLGTMVGLYESAIDELCSWTFDDKLIRPKIVASTATVRRADEQVRNVFMRGISIFPPSGLEASDNFFAVQRSVDEMPGRRYIGICAPGKSRPAVLIRVYVAFLAAAQALYEKYGKQADPYMTLVGYFNALRELGSMRRLCEDDVQNRTIKVAMSNVERPGLARRFLPIISELTSRISNKDIRNRLDHLQKEFDPEGEGRAIDVILATNMLSVGVDVDRLGLMVVNGQPKSTAEYIQATSRVGRSHPGIVCAVLNWARPRDLSHYETFEYFHETFYQHVEAQSVTPAAPRAMDRGLTGSFVSMLRQGEFELNPNDSASELENVDQSWIDESIETVAERIHGITDDDQAADDARKMLRSRIDSWKATSSKAGGEIGFDKESSLLPLLERPGQRPWQDFTVPTSMREVEPSVRVLMKDDLRDNAPTWKEQAKQPEGASDDG